jgi:hypothetical protein
MAQKRFRLLDSGRTWGSLDVYPSRYGITRHRLVMFPPGISRDERRILRAWRTWPMWGTSLFLFAQILLTNMTTPAWALALSTGLWLCIGAAVFALTGTTRARVRTVNALAVDGAHHEADADRVALIRGLAAVLLAADDRRAEGTLAEHEHEAICWQIYEQLAQFDDAPAVKRSQTR